MVTPNENVLYVFNGYARLFCNNALSSALIKSSKGSKVLFWNGWREVRSNQGVRVSWVAYYANLDGFLCYFVECLPLSLENLGVCT